MLAVPAIGFTAIYAVLRFPNFAVASHATIGAFAGYVANTAFGCPSAAVRSARGLPRGRRGRRRQRRGRPQARLRPPGSSPPPSASIALTIVLENIVRFVFGNDLRGYDLPIQRDWRSARSASARSRSRTSPSPSSPWPPSFCFSASREPARPCAPSPTIPMLADIKGIDADTVAASSTSAPWAWPASAAC